MKILDLDSPKRELIDNLTSIHGRIAIYNCKLPEGINKIDFYQSLCNHIYRSEKLDGYLKEEFICEDAETITLEIKLKDDETPKEFIDRYYNLMINKITYEDIGLRCLNGCGFCNNTITAFCSFCYKKYNNITEGEKIDMINKMFNLLNHNRRTEYRSMRSFLETPLPNFCFDYYDYYSDTRITFTFKCVNVIKLS